MTQFNNKEIQTKITLLIEASYKNPQAFVNFATEILNLGIIRMTFDAIKDEMSFYTKDQFVHSLLRKDLIDSRNNSTWVLGNALNIPKLEYAIKQLDAGNIDNPEFHREIFAAGVNFCIVYLDLRNIYYLSQDGSYYLEKY